MAASNAVQYGRSATCTLRAVHAWLPLRVLRVVVYGLSSRIHSLRFTATGLAAGDYHRKLVLLDVRKNTQQEMQLDLHVRPKARRCGGLHRAAPGPHNTQRRTM